MPLFLLLVAAAYALSAGMIHWKSQRTLKWRETDGMIIRSELDSRMHRRRHGGAYEVYRPLVEYTYNVPGKDDRIGTCVYYGADRWRKTADIADGILSRHLVGKPCRVYVNPGRLEESVLERGQTEGVKDNLTRAMWAALAAPAWWIVFKKILN